MNSSLAASRCTTTQRQTNNTNPSSSNQRGNDEDDTRSHHGMAVGRMVEVLPRTWPGINKPGGVARVTKVYLDIHREPKHVDVHYILARNKEKQVPLDYVQLAPQYEGSNTQCSSQPTTSLRDRSMLLGRCKRCGSLRTDCGSCDWAFEEMEQTRIQQHTEQSIPRSSKYRKRRKRQRASMDGNSSKWNALISGDDSSSNDDDSSDEEDQDDVLLQELMAQNMANYRKFRQFRVAQMLRQEAAKQHTPRKDEFSSSDDSEDEMYQTYMQYKQKMDRKHRTMNRHSSRGGSNHHVSILESIATDEGARISKAITPSTERFQAPRNKDSMVTPSESTTKRANDKLSDHSSPETTSPTIPRTNKPRRRRLVIQDESQDISHLFEDENNGDSSDHSFGMEDNDAEKSHNDMNQEQEMELEQEHVNRLVRQARQEQTDDHEVLALSQFIQPEGQDVAENLPDDIVDMTRNLKYPELPDFFDDMATRMEDEWMPDWKLKIARLASAKRRLEYSTFSSRSFLSPKRSPLRGPSVDPLQVLQECQEIQTEIRDELIRNGLDQCKICLYKLMDDRLYKRRKSKLTSVQRKKCRGMGIMDARNLRLDALEDTVDDLVRKIKEVEEACENHLQENGPMEDATQNEMQDSDDEQDLENTPAETLGIAPITGLHDKEPSTLPPFHPHMHARQVKSNTVQHVRRQKRSQNDELVHRQSKRKKSRTSRKNGRTESRNPRARRISLDDRPHNQSEDPSEPMDNGASFEPDSDHERDVEETQEEDHLPSNISIFLDLEASSGGRQKRSAEEQATSENRNRTRTRSTINPVSRRNDRQSSRSSRSTGACQQDDSSVPTFNLFDEDSPTREVAGNRHYRQGGRRQGVARVPISRRMQAFLLANEENNDDFYVSSEDATSGRVPRRSSSNRTSGKSHQVPAARSSSLHADTDTARDNSRSRTTAQRGASISRSDNRTDNSIQMDGDDTTIMMDLFDDLIEDRDDSGPTMGVVDIGSHSISAACQELQSAFRQPPRRREEIFGQVHAALHRDPLMQGSATVTALETGFTMLQENGTMTLLEVVCKKSTNLRSHVHLLSVCLLSLNKVTESSDVESYPIAKHFIENRRAFHDMVLLQLIDTLYAVLHPSAWAYKSKNSSHILSVMKPLRNALAKVTALSENACRCILEKLCCQKWRLGSSKDFAFVSSIDPSDWKTFLQDGTLPSEGTDVRVKALGNVWPRVEIEAAWSILAYLGQSPSVVDERSVSCWQMLSKLFSCGVLYQQNASNDTAKMDSLPPSVEHLNTCEQEIGFFTQLLSNGVLGTLPSSDSILVNLFRRSLALQGDSYQRNNFARKQSIPTLKRGKESKRFVARLWKASDPSYFLMQDRIRSKTLRSGFLSLGSAAQGDAATVKNALLPTSNILRRCLELLYVWIKQLPQKKARQNRFKKALNTMRATLVSVSYTTPTVVSPVKQDSFEAAFAMRREKNSLSDGAEHQKAFMTEAAAWTKIVEKVAQPNSDGAVSNPFAGTAPSTLVAEIWDIVASDIMKERRVALIDGKESQDTCTTTSSQIFVAAKVMASVAMLQMNICPWLQDTGEKVTHVWESETAKGDTATIEALVFSVSSVFACLHCLGDMKSSPYTSHVISIVTLVFTNMAAFFQISGIQRDEIGNSQLKEISAFVLLKIFKVLINSQGDDENAVSFQLFLTAVRSFAAVFLDSDCIRLKGTYSKMDQGEDVVQRKEDESDDIWGAIDDDLLASMDLDFGEAPAMNFSQELNETLKNALQQSKPSGRFVVPSGLGATNTLQMSPHGKHFVATELDKVCQCLVSLQLAIPNQKESSVLSELIRIRVQSYFEDDSDSQFWVQISQLLSTEAISLSKTFGSCSNLVKSNFDSVLFNVLGMVFDSQRLQVYPSCNLERIRKNAGDDIGEQALDLLDIFNTCDSNAVVGTGIETVAKMHRKRKRKAERVWRMCHQISNALLESESDHGRLSLEGRIASILQERDSDLLQKAPSLLDSSSLEKEAFHSFQILRTLVSVIDMTQKNQAVSMQSVMAFSVSFIIVQSLRTMKSLKYQESVITRESSNEQELRKIMTEELLRTYLEILVALVAWIFRNSRDGASKQWIALELQLRDNFIAPILRRRSIDLAITLQQILRTSLAVITGNSSSNSSALRLGPISGFSSYAGEILHSIVRRSRQLLIASSKHAHFRSLQSSLLEAAIGCTEHDEDFILPWYLGSAYSTSLEVKNASDVGPLGEGIDEYLSFVEKTVNNGDRLKKSRFLDGFILPRLNHGKTKLSIHRRNLRVVRHLLDVEVDDPTIDSNSIRALMKGMRHCLLQCLKESVIDNDFLSEVLSCANRLACIPIAIDDSRHEALLSWSRRSVEDGLPGDLEELSTEEQSDAYFWLFYKWLQNLGKIIVDKSENGTEKRSTFRKLLTSTGESNDSLREVSPSQVMLDMGLESSHRLLRQVEEFLFPSRDENNACVANVYANDRISQDSSTQQMAEEWKPTTSLRKCAKELMAEVVALG